MKIKAEVTTQNIPNLLKKGLGFLFAFLVLSAAPAKADITSNLTGYWNFDDGTADDCSQTNNGTCDGSNPGTLTNGAALLSPGAMGNGALSVAYSSSANQYVNVADNTSLDLPIDFTVAAWINMNTFGTNNSGTIVNKSVSNGGYTFSVNNNWDPTTQSNSPKALSFQFAGGNTVTSSNNVINTGAWYHVAFTRQGTSGTFYVNGFPQGTYTVPSANNTQAVPLQIGEYFNGKIDEVRVYNGRALTVHEILALCGSNAVCAPNTFPPVFTLIQSGNITSTSATITWTTDEPASSQVNYGTSTSYGSFNNVDSVLGSSLGLSHSVALSGLVPGTVYHYQVVATDAQGNTGTSSDYTFTTDAAVGTNAVNQSTFYTTPGVYLGKPYNGASNYSNVISEALSNGSTPCYLEPVNIQTTPPSSPITDNTYYGTLPGSTPYLTANELAINLPKDGSIQIPLQLNNLPWGTYMIRLVGRVNDTVPRIRKPLYIHLDINDGIDPTTGNPVVNHYRMRVNYDNTLEEVGRFFFNALNTRNNLTATIYLGAGSQEDLLIHRIDFFDALAGTAKQGYKTTSSTFTASEQQYTQALAAQPPTALDPDFNNEPYSQVPGWQNLENSSQLGSNYNESSGPTDRSLRDQLIWNNMPQLNTMTGGCTTGCIAALSELPSIDANGNMPGNPSYNGTPLTPAQVTNQFGYWALDICGGNPNKFSSTYLCPWKLIHYNGNSVADGPVYTMADYQAHKTLPSPYPFSDDGAGFYFQTADNYGNSPGSYQFTVSGYMTQEFQNYSWLLDNGSASGGGLPYAYYLTGNTTWARDASLVLVRWALQWPTFQFQAQDVGLNAADPLMDYNTDWRWNGGELGNISVASNDGTTYIAYLQAYDWLFDYICWGTSTVSTGACTNTDFAQAVHKFVPWVNTPSDVITLLDTYLVQSTVVQTQVGWLGTSNNDPMFPGLVQGPSPMSNALMDIYQAQVNLDVFGTTSYYNQYFNNFNQDGTEYIGSSFYTQGESDIFLPAIDTMQRYEGVGGTVPHDLSNMNEFPKVKAFGSFLLDMMVGGGYQISVGDVGGNPDASIASTSVPSALPSNALFIWNVDQDPKAAWYLVNYIGRTTEGDAQWAAIKSAAATIGDPRLNSSSRVFAGFGVGILESGVGDPNFQHHRAVVIRAGTGSGHAHQDSLSLSYFAMGLRMANEFAERNESNLVEYPPDSTTYTENTVEVDGFEHPWKAELNWPGGNFSTQDSWDTIFKPTQDSQFISTEGLSLDHPDVSVYRRDTALVDIDANDSYIFDVFRVSGGKMHTWVFHGADSGVESDVDVNGLKGFNINIPMTPVSTNSAASFSAQYLRKHANDTIFEGTAPTNGPVQAIWRLSRTSATVNENDADGAAATVTTVAAEQALLGSNYNPSSPRKYTRATIFNSANQNVLVGNLYSQYYQMDIPILYVQHRPSSPPMADPPQVTSTDTVPAYSTLSEIDDVYPVIIEAYAGTPLVSSSSALAIANNDTNYQQAVALQVNTTTGNQDFMFSDAHPGAVRSVQIPSGSFGLSSPGTWTASGTFAYYSQNQKGFRKLHLVGGGQFNNGALSVQSQSPIYSAQIVSVNYALQQITINQTWPAGVLNGDRVHIFNANHNTNYMITNVAPQGNGTTVLTFDKPADIGLIGVTAVSGNTITGDYSWAMMGTANRVSGYTAVNESGSKTWKMQSIGSASACTGNNCFSPNLYQYQLTGPSFTMSDFTDVDGEPNNRSCVIVYDFGVGDTVEDPTDITLGAGATTGTYTLQADTAVTLTLPGQGNIQVSPDGVNWTSLSTTLNNGAVAALLPASSAVQYIQVAATLTPVSSMVYGDVNGDGKVTIYDAELTAQKAIGLPVANFNVTSAEVDGNSNVDIYDAYLIAEYAIGSITKFPVQQ